MCYRISQAFTGFVPSFIESSELSETGFSIGFYLVFFYWVFNTEVEGGEVAASCQHSAAHFPCRFAAETRCRRLFISQRRRNSFFFCFVVVVVVVLFVQGFKLHQVTSCEATLPAGSINAPSSRFSHRYVPKKKTTTTTWSVTWFSAANGVGSWFRLFCFFYRHTPLNTG